VRFGQQRRRHQALNQPQRQALLAPSARPVYSSSAGAALADDARQHRAGAHVAAGQADAVEQERRLRRAPCPGAVGRQRHHGAGPGAHAVDGGHDGLRAHAHGLDQVAGHAGEHQQLGRLQRVSGPMISCTSPPEQKLPPSPVITTPAHVAGVDQAAEQVAQLGIAVEGQRILASGRFSVTVATRPSSLQCQPKWRAG
jgi:hypothetical protein